jgi:hypothetical protein
MICTFHQKWVEGRGRGGVGEERLEESIRLNKMRSMWQVARMAENGETYTILMGKFIGQRTLGNTKA